MPLTIEDAVQLIEDEMRSTKNPVRDYSYITNYGSYGYDIYLPSLAANKLSVEYHSEGHKQAVGVLMDAAWWFVGKGILRPGVKAAGKQSTEEGASVGFSITQLGHEWLTREQPVTIPVTSPTKMRALFTEFGSIFSPAFVQRANEAVSCYDSRNYLASCAMSGASAESILIDVAVAKTQDEAMVLATYVARDGRRNVEKLILGQAKQHIRDQFAHHMELLKYWRDQAAHGAATQIGEPEAYLALVGLVRFARFVKDDWADLTS